MLCFHFPCDFFLDFLFKNVFNYSVFVNFPISFFIVFYFPSIMVREDTLLDFNILLRFILWLNIWSILENIPCSLEKNVYYLVIRLIVLYMVVRSNWFLLPVVQIMFYLLIFWLVVLTIIEVENWNLRLLFLNFFLFSTFSFCFIYCGALVRCMYVYTCFTFQ